jgi:hypothetical protein
MNLQEQSIPELTTLKAAILRELSRRRKAARPKVRRQKRIDPEADDRRKAWNLMLRFAEHCEACGHSQAQQQAATTACSAARFVLAFDVPVPRQASRR